MPTTLPERYPPQYESRFTLKDGREVFLRPIPPTDEPLLVDLFNKISPQTRYLRFLRHLHALPEDMLHQQQDGKCPCGVQPVENLLELVEQLRAECG